MRDLLCPQCCGELDPEGDGTCCRKCGAYFVELSDSLEFQDSTEVLEGPNVAYRIDRPKRKVDTDFTSLGQVSTRVEADPRRGEANVPEVRDSLIARLNRDGASWRVCSNQGSHETGVDCRACDGDRQLNIQVTRATGDQKFWSDLARGPVEYSTSVRSLVDELRTAIDNKATAPKAGIVLELDSIETPHIGVADQFRLEHGEWARSLGWDAIWLVGPFQAERLDETS